MNKNPLLCKEQIMALGVLVSILAFFAQNACAETNISSKIELGIRRDPFWPVGYQPEGEKKEVEQVATEETRPSGTLEWNEAMKLVVINGVSKKDDEHIAIVNGKLKSVGDSVSVNHKGIVYTWVVDSIKPPGSVELRRVSAL